MARRIGFALYILLVVTLLAMIWRANEERLLVDATPVCAPRVNPCSVQRCEAKFDTKELT